jgi:uncharacterized protein YkwD
MTLTKRPVRRPKPAAIKRRAGQHHKQTKHYSKAYWPYLPIVAIVSFGLVLNVWMSQWHRTTLGYATDMSVQALLDGTNNQRNANGQASLGLNGLLNQAAQNKANDMAARNYWSHNTPDGQTPWTFISAVGYNYQKAGENLAYGFATAGDTITGWMNSPEHRANILNASYQEVGFGIVNIPNYQSNGPQTLVVAMYALPASVAAAPAPAPSQPAATKPVQQSTPSTPTSAAPVAEPTPTEQAAPVKTVAPTPDALARPDTAVAASQRDTVNEQRVARVQLFTAGNASWSLMAMVLIAICGLIIFLGKHAVAWHRFLRRGESFILHHPLFDIAIVSLATVGFILSQTSGLIR